MTPVMSRSSSSSSAVIHSVHFYDQDEALIQRLRGIVKSAVETGNSALIVATEKHRAQLVSELENSGLDVSGLAQDKRLNLHDAREILSKLIVDKLPDPGIFRATIGNLVAESKRTAWNAQRGLTVFGEMVALLWEDGDYQAALQVEELWNDLLNNQAFHLHCAYPRHILQNGDAVMLRAICDGHSHVIGVAA